MCLLAERAGGRPCDTPASGLSMWRAMAQAVMIPQPEVTALVESTYLERLTWASAGSTTPFGAPVEPEVYLVAHSTVVYIALV